MYMYMADLILVISSAWPCTCVMEHAQNESKWWILYWELLNRPPIHQSTNIKSPQILPAVQYFKCNLFIRTSWFFFITFTNDLSFLLYKERERELN